MCYKLYIGNKRIRFNDCLQSGHSAFSRPHPTMQLQQKRCPHSVAQLSVRSSKQRVQLRPARIFDGMEGISRMVRPSSSAGLAGSPSGLTGPRKDDTGWSSIYVSFPRVWFRASSFPLIAEPEALRMNAVNRYSRRTAINMPSTEYDGGRVWGSCGREDTCCILSARLTRS